MILSPVPVGGARLDWRGTGRHAAEVREFLTVLAAVVPVFLVMLAGWGMRRLDWLTEEADASLMRVTVNLLVPCLAFDALLGNPAMAQAGNVLAAPAVGFGTVSLGLGVAWAVRRWIPERTPSTRRTFVFSVGMYNYGYVPLPLAMALFGRETVAVLFVHNVGVEVAMWAFGPWLLGGLPVRTSARKLLSPALCAIVGTVLLNLVVTRDQVPGVVLDAVHLLGQCAVPMGLVLIGATVADYAHEFVSRQGGRVMGWALVLRLGVLPMLFLGLMRTLPLPVELRQVMVLQAAMPAAVFPIVMARLYGGDPATALRVVLSTSLAGLATIPLWIRVGLGWLRE